MIKELIKDLAYDKITLNQGLTRAKLIAYKINDDTFKDWINQELNGYSDLTKLPSYRIISCQLFGVIHEPFRGQRQIPIFADELNKWLDDKLDVYKMNIVQSVSTLEENVSKAESIFGYEEMPPNIVETFIEITSTPNLIKVQRRIQISELKHIVNLTKQKLVDTLLELDKSFPNLTNEYMDTKENIEKVQNIITNNIYGNNANTNVGIGDKVEQTQNITYNEIEKNLNEIEKLGVDKKDVDELKSIVTSKEDKTFVSKKVFTWLGDITKKTIEKGIDLNLPILMEKLKELI